MVDSEDSIPPEIMASILLGDETLTLEFKEDKGSFSDTDLVKSVVAMANCEGGCILVGVADNAEVVGSTRFEKHWRDPRCIEGMLLENTVPAVPTKVNVYREDGKPVVAVFVPRFQTTVGTKKGRYLKRRIGSLGKPENMPMNVDEIVGGLHRIGSSDLSTTVLADADIRDLNLELAGQYFARLAEVATDAGEKNTFSQDPQGVLQTLGLITLDRRPNIAGLLLFGKAEVLRERLPNFYVQYQVFGEGGALPKNLRFTEPIAKLFPMLLDLPELKRNSDEFVSGGRTYVVPEYPHESLRESFANALVHRDYALPAGIQIQLCEGELHVCSPGGFPMGVNLNNLLSATPTPRNRRLAEAMMRLKFVESSGRGIDFIFSGQARYGRPAPDYSSSNSDQVSVRLAGGRANLEFCKFIFSTVENASINELLILNALFFQRDLSLEEVERLLQRSRTVTQQILFSMSQKGLLQISYDRNPKYFLKGSLHRIARDKVKPRRMTREQLAKFQLSLMAELKRRNPAPTTDLADAVGLSNSQAYRLLARLKKLGKVNPTSDKMWEPIE